MKPSVTRRRPKRLNHHTSTSDPTGLQPRSFDGDWEAARDRQLAGLVYWGDLYDRTTNCFGDTLCGARGEEPERYVDYIEFIAALDEEFQSLKENECVLPGDIVIFRNSKGAIGHAGTVVGFDQKAT